MYIASNLPNMLLYIDERAGIGRKTSLRDKNARSCKESQSPKF